MLETRAGLQIDGGELLDDDEQPVGVVELLDLLVEFETLEDLLRLQREAADVGDEVSRDVVGVSEEPGEGVGARVVEWLLATLGGRLRQLGWIARSGSPCFCSSSYAATTAPLVGSSTQSRRRSTVIGSITRRYCGGR